MCVCMCVCVYECIYACTYLIILLAIVAKGAFGRNSYGVCVRAQTHTHTPNFQITYSKWLKIDQALLLNSAGTFLP